MMLLKLSKEIMMMLLKMNIEVMMLLKLSITKLRMESTWARNEEDIVKYAVRQLETESS